MLIDMILCKINSYKWDIFPASYSGIKLFNKINDKCI